MLRPSSKQTSALLGVSKSSPSRFPSPNCWKPSPGIWETPCSFQSHPSNLSPPNKPPHLRLLDISAHRQLGNSGSRPRARTASPRPDCRPQGSSRGHGDARDCAPRSNSSGRRCRAANRDAGRDRISPARLLFPSWDFLMDAVFRENPAATEIAALLSWESWFRDMLGVVGWRCPLWYSFLPHGCVAGTDANSHNSESSLCRGRKPNASRVLESCGIWTTGNSRQFSKVSGYSALQ